MPQPAPPRHRHVHEGDPPRVAHPTGPPDPERAARRPHGERSPHAEEVGE
ncbi:MAG TPA: hypothetical protein VHH36_06615 [Candidatus Thermoplasmatota archaeon]|nr:hypothetical protein [Candidatus Thermoplasmatota archaeon]